MVAGESLPGGSLDGFPYVVIDVSFLPQVILVRSGLEQKLPKRGHPCGFAKQVTSLDLNSEVLPRGAEERGAEGNGRLIKKGFQDWVFSIWLIY